MGTDSLIMKHWAGLRALAVSTRDTSYPDLHHPARERSHDVVFLLGAPGAGKSSLLQHALFMKEEQEQHVSHPGASEDQGPVFTPGCKHVDVRHSRWHHIYPGALLRAYAESEQERAGEVRDILLSGKLVPPELTVFLMAKAMQHKLASRPALDEYALFIVDGFPRGIPQWEEWQDKMGYPVCTIEVTAPLESLQQRILARGKTSQRSDDNMESLALRMETYEQETRPVLTILDQIHHAQHHTGIGLRTLPYRDGRNVVVENQGDKWEGARTLYHELVNITSGQLEYRWGNEA